MRICGLGTSYSDPEIFCLYKQVEKHAVVFCQTEELYMHIPKTDFRTQSMKYLPTFALQIVITRMSVSKMEGTLKCKVDSVNRESMDA